MFILILFYLLNNNLLAFEKVVIILGPPGSGKGTQAQLLRDELEWPALAHSAIKAQERINRPELTNIYNEIKKDQWTKDIFKTGLMMINIGKNKSCSGIILENWPRTPEALSSFLLTLPKAITVIELVAPEEALLSRVQKRKQCPQCGASYGHARQESTKNLCDECKALLITRLSDNPQNFPARLLEYRERQRIFRMTFKERGIAIHQINALGDPTEIHYQIMAIVLEGSKD